MTYSVAEARKRLPQLLRAAQSGERVEITRRGKPVAVVVSIADYRHLAGEVGSFSQAYHRWRQSVDPADLDLPADYFRGLRDRAPGRDTSL